MQIVKEAEALNIAVEVVKNGQVIVCPTDTVYGLVCDASNFSAVEKIFEIKKRDVNKPLGVFVGDMKSAGNIAFIDKAKEEFLKDNKTTCILKIKDKNLSPLVSRDGKIGIRIPRYDFLNSLLKKIGKSLAQTSANISGEEATTKINEVVSRFKDSGIIIIDAGDLLENEPSRVIDLTGESIKILRR